MAERMRGLTLWRPWDTAVLLLGKPLENRGWPPPPKLIGQRIALHSGKKWDSDGALSVVRLAFNHGKGLPSKVITAALNRAETQDSVILGTVKIACFIRRGDPVHMKDPLYSSRWFFGEFGWVCEEPFALPEPVPCRGMQGLWPLPADVEARVREQEAHRVEQGRAAGQ